MKMNHFFWIASAIVAVTAMAAGIAVFVSRFLAEEDEENYLECADEEFEE